MIRKMIFPVVAVAVLVALCSMFPAGASAAPVSQQVTLTGYISCTTCMMPNACKAQTRLACTQQWIGQGASYVIVVDGTHYRLSGFPKELAKAAAENSVTITGELSGKDVTVTSVELPRHEK
jgi:hypothetical protein